MKEEARKQIWVDLSSHFVDGAEGVKVDVLIGLLAFMHSHTLVSMSHDHDDDRTNIYTGHWRMETDEEYEERLKRLAEFERVSTMSGTLIPTAELAILREKAAKYDDLCK